MKKIFVFSFMTAMLLGVSMQAHAVLQNLGTDNLGNQLIYDTDLDITWYDYTHTIDTWDNQLAWADALSVTFGGVTYNNWRLPITFDQSCSGHNCTNSEMGHLFYTELGNSAGDPVDTGDFQNLQTSYLWSATTYSDNTSHAWAFGTHTGYQYHYGKSNPNLYAIAVHPGLAAAPEPVSSILFVVGSTLLGGRFYLRRTKVNFYKR